MKSSFRFTTALVTSLSLVAGHMPFAALAQTADAACLEGETAEACLARALAEAAAADAASRDAAAAEAARVAEEAAAAAAAAEAAAAAQAQAEAQAAAAAQAAAEQAAAQAAADAAAQAAAEQAAAQATADAAAQAAADQAAAEAAADAAAQAAAEQAAAQAAADAAAQAAAEQAAAQATADAAAQAAADQAAAQAAADAAAQATADAAAQAAAEAEAAAAATADTPQVEAAPATDAVTQTAPVGETAPVAETAPIADTAQTPTDPATRATDEAALAAALAAAAAEQAGAADDGAPQQTAEEAAALQEAARLAAEAEQEAAADPIVEAEVEAEVQAVEAEEQLQSMALVDDAQPVGEIVIETITEEASRSADEEFTAIVTTEPAAGTPVTVQPSGRNGLNTLETALLAGAAGLVVGTILSGNRQVVNRAEDRVVVLRPQGDFQVIRDDDVLLRRPGNGVTTENFADGSSRSIVTQPDGAQIVTIRDRDLRILRRTYFDPNGFATVLIDDTAPIQPVIVSQLPQVRPVVGVPITNTADANALRLALEGQQTVGRSFSLAQVRSIRAVRDLAPAVDLESVTFASGSAAIGPEEARALLALGTYMADAIARNPREIFLVEGHTDAVGSAAFNLALSDRRAESVALSLSQFFGVPAQNLVIQGYGEDYLRIPTLADERLNRRVAVRRITDLLQVAAAN